MTQHSGRIITTQFLGKLHQNFHTKFKICNLPIEFLTNHIDTIRTVAMTLSVRKRGPSTCVLKLLIIFWYPLLLYPFQPLKYGNCTCTYYLRVYYFIGGEIMKRDPQNFPMFTCRLTFILSARKKVFQLTQIIVYIRQNLLSPKTNDYSYFWLFKKNNLVN